MRYFIFIILCLTPSVCLGVQERTFSEDEISQELIDQIECVDGDCDHLHELPSIVIAPQDDSEAERLRDLFPFWPNSPDNPEEEKDIETPDESSLDRSQIFDGSVMKELKSIVSVVINIIKISLYIIPVAIFIYVLGFILRANAFAIDGLGSFIESVKGWFKKNKDKDSTNNT